MTGSPNDTLSAESRPTSMRMPIQGGMLEALGINMYTKLGKCLVEFVANSYDSEATRVDITIPMSEISAARKELRARMKALVEKGEREPFDVLLEPLPRQIKVSIKDNGHGMSWVDIRDKYLPLNRKRRTSSDGKERNTKSETGKRFVMGRKGLGKLAGFGAAMKVEVKSTRKGEAFATHIVMEDNILKGASDLSGVEIPTTYDDSVGIDEHWTEITLSGLKSDAVREQESTLKKTIAEAFYGIRPENFSIYLNNEIIEAEAPNYALIVPKVRSDDGFAKHTIQIEDVGAVNIRYFVGFRKQSLPAKKRGARIYCNNRLAAGPSLLELPTGMHSFHSTDYMECIVEADELDRAGIDFINTNRSELREDTEVVRELYSQISLLMKAAISEHAKFKVAKAEEDLNKDPTGQMLNKIISTLPKKQQKNTRKLLVTLASEHPVGSESFEELAPIVVNSINATEVLSDLISLRTNPETIAKVASQLRELGEIERDDVLKLYRARRNGILALEELWVKGEEEWKKAGIENELHDLFKQNPWLIRPEFSNFLTSDEGLNTAASKLAKQLKIDDFAPILNDGKPDSTRPDLVFIMSDPSLTGPHILNVVELKSPTVPLQIEHHSQLERYLYQLRQWTDANVPHSVSIRGYLIGTMPRPNATAVSQGQLLKEYERQGAQSEVRIIGLTELIHDSKAIHIEAINALEMLEDEASASATD